MSKKSWTREILNQQASGQSVSRYCQERGLSTSTFRYWLKKVEKAGLEEGRFVEVRESSPPIEVISPSGMTLRVDSRIRKSELKELIACLS